jgi:predicted lactoylglutathione lyase
MTPKLTVITLGVANVAASAKFYEALGFRRKMRKTGDEVAFFDAGGLLLAVWGEKNLLDDTQLSHGQDKTKFNNASLAWNCTTPREVDAAFAQAMAAGGKPLRQPGKTDYGGYRGYFADPDGHVWEVVQAPGFGFTDDGRLIAPD